MTPTKAQLKSIEWAVPNAFGAAVTCPVCYGTKDYNGHSADCWLAACLTTPDDPPAIPEVVASEAFHRRAVAELRGAMAAPPAVEVGDVVDSEIAGLEHVGTPHAAESWAALGHGTLRAIYRPVWVKETP